jgi:hypothetical protein
MHGIAGETAPPAVGPVELVVGLLLAAAVDWRRAIGLLLLRRRGPGDPPADPPADPVPRPAMVAFHLLLWPPLLLAAGTGTPSGDMVRDLVPLCFLALALILPPAADADRMVGWLAAGLAFAGAAIALRVATGLHVPLPRGGIPYPPWGAALLLNDPSVAFAAALATVVALRAGGLAAVAASVPAIGILGVLLAAGHRAGVVAVAVAAMVSAVGPTARGRLAFAIVALSAAAVAGLADRPVAAFDGLLRKTASVGLNARPAELAAAIATAADGPLGLLFGQGWGALFVNPATGGDPVRYAHGLPVHLIVKSGLSGAVAGGVLVIVLAAPVVRKGLSRAPAPVLAALPTLAIGLTVHTSHKFLTFGLVLALLASVRATALERQSTSVYRTPMPASSPAAARPVNAPLAPALSCLVATALALVAGVVWLRSTEPRHSAVAVVGPAPGVALPGDRAGRPEGRLSDEAAAGGVPFLRATELLAGGLLADDLAARPGLLGSVLGEGTVGGPVAAAAAMVASLAGRTVAERPDADRLGSHLRTRFHIEPTAQPGLRRITYRHADPRVAEMVIALSVAGADARLRRSAQGEAEALIAHLGRLLADGSGPTDRRLALSALLEEQERRRLLLAADRPHAIAFVHGPVASLRPDDPDPVVVLAVAALGGFAAGLFVGVVRRRGDR